MALLAIVTLPIAGFGQIISNGTGGGDWAQTSTWAGGVVPSGSVDFQIAAGDTVTAGAGVATTPTGADSELTRINGTLTVNGSNISAPRLNALVTATGTLNVNSGTFSAARFAHNVNSSFVANVNGGILELRDNNPILGGVTFNVSGGRLVSGVETFNTNDVTTPTAFHLTGGRVEFVNGFRQMNPNTWAASTWNGGGIYLNERAAAAQTPNWGVDATLAAWATNASNIIGMSSKSTAQNPNLGTAVNATQGILEFNIYSPTSSDMLTANSFNLSSGVTIQIMGVDLAGTIGDYIGQSFQILDPANADFSSIAATVITSDLTIGGDLYEGVQWQNNLGVDGTITFVPEPSTYALMFGGVVLGLAIVRRRKTAA